MAVITPQTEIRLVKCPLELSDLNQLTFSNVSAQYTYFNSLPHVTADNATYQRKDGYVRFPAEFDEIIQYNYVMYQNEAYSNKWFYAYITKMEYLSNGSTAVYIQTDTFQTWQFDLTYKQCFVEREHTMDDTIGVNTVPEDLELGPYVAQGDGGVLEYNASSTGGYYNLVAFQVTELLAGMHDSNNHIYNGTFSGLYIFGVAYSDAINVIRAYDAAGKGDDIVAIFYAIGGLFGTKWTDLGTFDYWLLTESSYAINLNTPTTVAINATIDGYTPKNNKLFTAPFNYLHVTNNAGIDVDYHYEDFKNNTPKFAITGVISQGCSTKLIPIDYKNLSEAYNFAITGSKLPICAWASDYYTNWVTQNALNVGLSTASSVAGSILSGGGSRAAGNKIGVAGSLLSVFSDIGSAVAQYHQASIMPDQAKGNTNAGDINFSSRQYFFHWSKRSIKAEYARIIDDYLSVYGYKTNRVKVPNVFGRTNWNFVKTIGCYIDGDIPQEDMQRIKEMFDAGVTFWHNPSTFMNYSASNTIVV